MNVIDWEAHKPISGRKEKMRILFSTIACIALANLVAAPKEPSPVSQQCCPDVFKPCGVTYHPYFEFLYLQPNGSDLYYGVQADGLDTDIAVPAISPNWTVLEIDPNYHPGFELGVSFLLNCANLNIDLKWQWMHGHDSDSFTTSPANGFMVGPFFDIGPNASAYKVAKGKATSHFDAIDLTFGKELCFFNQFYTYFYAGAGFARIHEVLNSSWANTANTISRAVENSSTFVGAGPEIGLDYRYRIYRSFFFTGHSQLALLMGQLKNHTTFTSFTPELTSLNIPQPNVQNTTVPNRTQLIPAFEQKLGFSYLATWNCVRATFELGYQCQIYLDAIQTVDMTAPQVLPAGAIFTTQTGVFAVGFERTLSNYILTGPYAFVGVEF